MAARSERRRRVVADTLRWYAGHARDLPWRSAAATPWQILVSEVMLQQTPVARVLGPWRAWVDRWPTAAALAAEPAGEAVRQWSRLGYPRRALRLWQAATVIVEQHDGEVPHSYDALLRLPGIGDYTAAAVASFAYGRRHVVLDTNVRRVLARLELGRAFPEPTPRTYERTVAEQFLPRKPHRAARWSVAAMELGALVCTARAPRCGACPVADLCVWRGAGHPEPTTTRRGQSYEGTDRQCRGRLLAVVRDAAMAVPVDSLSVAWPDTAQRERALASLLDDGLLVSVCDSLVGLP